MRIILLSVFFLISLIASSQTKPAPPFSASLDCADNNVIQKTNLLKCEKIVLVGPGAEKNKVVLSAEISFKVGGVIKKFVVIEGVLNKETKEQLSKASSGSYFFIENVRAKNPIDSVIMSLSPVKITVK